MLEEQEWGLATFGTYFASTRSDLLLELNKRITIAMSLHAPAKRIRSCRNFAVVAGMFKVG